MNDLNEFILQKFREAAISESEDDGHRHSSTNPEAHDVDAFDYVNDKKKKSKKLTKTQKAQRQQFLQDSNKALMASSEEEYSYDSESDDYDSDEDQLTRKIFGKERQIYCAICAGKHSEEKCNNKQYSKSQSFNNIRENFARATSFKQVGQYYDRRRDRSYDRDDRYDRYDRYDRNSKGS